MFLNFLWIHNKLVNAKVWLCWFCQVFFTTILNPENIFWHLNGTNLAFQAKPAVKIAQMYCILMKEYGQILHVLIL